MADASDADMSRFVSQRLKRLALSSEDKSHRSRVAVPGVASAICTMAGANFLYASMVLGALEKGTLKPKSLLMSLNGGDHAAADKGLAGMYTDSFQRIFARPADYNGNRINPCRALLEVLLAANRPLSQVSLDSSLAYCANATQTLRVYLHSSGTGEGSMEADSSEPTWKIFHSSLADWLTEQGGAAELRASRHTADVEKHPYHCNVGRGHALLAVGLLRRLFKTAGMRGPVRRSGAESAIRRWLGEGLSLHLPVDSPELPTPVAPSVVYDVAFHLAMATSLAGFPSGAHLLDRLRMATVSTSCETKLFGRRGRQWPHRCLSRMPGRRLSSRSSASAASPCFDTSLGRAAGSFSAAHCGASNGPDTRATPRLCACQYRPAIASRTHSAHGCGRKGASPRPFAICSPRGVRQTHSSAPRAAMPFITRPEQAT